MEAKRSQFVLKLLPSFTDFAFLMPIVFLFGRMAGLKSLFGDGDTGWHIRAGEWILANGRVPTQDIFSFSRSAEPWYAWEWLSDVVLARCNALGGLNAVGMLAIVLLSATFTLVYLEARRKSNAVVAIWVTIIAAAASSIHWLARPHLFTLLFLVLFYRALEAVRERRAGVLRLAILPAAMVLWTNLHAGFFVGILMICAYGAGELLHLVFAPGADVRRAAWQKARAYFLSAGGCAIASFVNPYTWHLHAHMAKYLGNPWNGQHVNEFFSPNFHHPTAIFFEMMLVMGAAAALWHASKGRHTEPLLLLVWAHGGLIAARNIPIFSILAAPMAAAAIQQTLSRAGEWEVAGWLRKAAQWFNRVAAAAGEKELVARWHLVSALGLALVAAVTWAPNPPKKFKAEFDPKTYPAAALAAMKFDASSRVFTNDEWGDYLIYRLYPNGRVFVDGRSDFYGNEFGDKYLDILRVKYGWEETLSRFGVDTILMPLDAPLTGALKESRRWRVVYDDGIALVFRSAAADEGEPISAATGGGKSRDREATKTEATDLRITDPKQKG